MRSLDRVLTLPGSSQFHTYKYTLPLLRFVDNENVNASNLVLSSNRSSVRDVFQYNMEANSQIVK